MDAERDDASTICSLFTRLRLRHVPAALAVAGLVVLRWASAGSASLDDAWQLGSASVAAAACLWRGTLTTGRLRRAWVCIGLGCAGWAAGQALWMVGELGLHRPTPFPSLADAGFLAFPVGMLAGITAFPVRPDRALRRDVLDGAILALTLLAISWTVGLQPVVGVGSTVLADAVSLAYPVANVAVLTTAVLAVGRARRHRRALFALVVAAAGGALSDAAFTYTTTRDGGYAGGGWTSTGWILAFTTIAVASGLRPRRGAARPDVADALVTSRTLRRHAVLAVLPYLPLAATVAVAGVAVLHDGRIDPVAALLVAAAVTLTLVRQFLTVRDNQLLLARVAQQQEALERQAFHDPLTGLANRTRFVGELEAALAGGGAGGVGVLFCDLDDFKSVNDGLGHGAGDALLADVAERLSDAVAGDGLLARLGGDEFAVLVRAAPGDDVEEAAGALAERVTRVVQTPFAVGDRPVRVGISVGLAVVPAGGHPTAADAALSRADVAMYTAKRSTDRRPVLWTPGLALPEAQDWRILPALDQALAAGTLPAHYQPVVDLGTGTVTGFEALARWPDPADGLTPADFLPVAVRNGLVRALTAHMVGTAARQLATWIDGREDTAYRPLRVSVNVSPSELVDPGLLRLVEPLVTELDLPAGSLVLEVTEDALLEDGAAAARAARSLHGLGVHVALDDFGSGYSALAHLTRVPFDVLKLDRQLVRDADRSPASRTLLRGVVQLAGELALSVVAEGVERASQAEVLLDLGCTLAQGYLFAPALPAQEVDLRSGAYAADGAAARAVGTVGAVGTAGTVGTVDAVPQQRQ